MKASSERETRRVGVCLSSWRLCVSAVLACDKTFPYFFAILFKVLQPVYALLLKYSINFSDADGRIYYGFIPAKALKSQKGHFFLR